MKVSIIIVSYNVKHYLMQCLQSVVAATKEVEAEIWVVDNVSKDDSVAAVRAHFPQVKLIANKENVGFSKANNQAIALAIGEYILILNPDTVLAEDTIVKCIAFMLSHKQAGALGVRMIDGTGQFLPESKRGLPTPEVAFYKMFGLSRLFPTSRRFGKYHLGFLSEKEDHAVDILSGAFMFFRKEVLDKIGGFDEAFFMYGEDIDLSWRVIQGGYKNYYLAENTIIHYKGESTKRGSLNYVKVFYEAMIIFARKHFAKNSASLYAMFINMAVVFRGLLTLIANVLSSSALVLVDFGLAYFVSWSITHYWAENIKQAADYYPDTFIVWLLPTYCFLWMAGVYWSGGYEKPYKLIHVVKGILYSTLLITLLYAFLPDYLRYSRAIVLLGAVAAVGAFSVSRLLYNLIRHKQFSFTEKRATNWLFVGSEEECKRAEGLIRKSEQIDFLVMQKNIDSLADKCDWLDIDEVVFCARDISYKSIIAAISERKTPVRYKILQANEPTFIGSNSSESAGDLIIEGMYYNLAKPLAQRKKRWMDVALCLVLPLSFRKRVVNNWWLVLKGKKTWVGYFGNDITTLPYPKEAVYTIKKPHPALPEIIHQINRLYAQNQSILGDLGVLMKELRKK